MKCSEAIKKLKEDLIIVSESSDQDLHDAISLAIEALRFRLSQKASWAYSFYGLLPGEDKEDDKTPVKA